MVSDTLHKIRMVETQAVSIEEMGRGEKDRTIRFAKKDTKEIISKYVDEANLKAQEKREKAQKQAVKMLEEAKERSKVEVELLKKEAMKKQLEVSKKVAELIV